MNEADKLAALLLDGTIDEILAPLQSGKEASLFVVRRGNDVVAAKVYKDREHRSFKNNAVYVEGRKQRSSRDERALARGSRHGKATQESLWRTAESETMTALYDAGVTIPRPLLIRDGVVLMELVTGANGEPAPRLVDTRPTPEEARKTHAILLAEIEKMLVAGWVHGDLSAYNVLVSARGPVIIDFPQAASVSHNNQARRLVERDVANVTDFLAGFDPALARSRSAGSALWERYQRGELGPAPGGLETSADPEDELASQIARAIAMPQPPAPARARGRSHPRGRGRAGHESPARGEPSDGREAHDRPEPLARREPSGPRKPEPGFSRKPDSRKPDSRKPDSRKPDSRRPDARKAPEPVEHRPREAARRPPAGPGKRPPQERRDARASKPADLWGFVADRYGLGENPPKASSRPDPS